MALICMFLRQAWIALVWDAWMALPGIGALMSKGTEYLNKYVIWAFGVDETHGPIAEHFGIGDGGSVALLMHMLNWSASALQFLIIVSIQTGMLDGDSSEQLGALGVCIATAGVRQSSDVERDEVDDSRV